MQLYYGTALVALFAYLVSQVYTPVNRALTVFGMFRTPSNTHTENENDFVTFPDTVHCEDLHHHLASNKLFTACEGPRSSRFSWFPPLGSFDSEAIKGQGSLHVIDPTTMKAQRLTFENFASQFVTHGIDVISDPSSTNAVYIYAVNHLPNPDPSSVHKARSQIELFHHVLGSTSAKHVRSIRDPLISTPNDILAVSPTSFYVTNDHHYREGLLRHIEDIIPAATWTTTMFVQIDLLGPKQATEGVKVTPALSGLHNNNGLGRGAQHEGSDEVLIVSAASGTLHRMTQAPGNDNNLTLVERVQLDSTLDNPSFFKDPYAEAGGDASGYVLAGLSKAVDLAKHKNDPDATDPVVVWYVRKGERGTWEKRVIFEDDGSRIRSSSAAVIVGIDPADEGGKKKGWLFVTGFMSKSMVAVKVDL